MKRSLINRKLGKVERALDKAIESAEIPGAVVLARMPREGELLEYEWVRGLAVMRPERLPAMRETIYDLASLTKNIATTTATMLLIVLAKLVLEWAGLQFLHMGIMLVFFVLTAWIAMRQVLFTGSIDRHSIIGAVCIYLLFGMIWTVLYLLAAALSPGSFNGLIQGQWYENFTEIIYFSFVTLTTLGYGDINPALPLVRFLAYMEAIVGQLYIAILVASLVGTHIADRRQEDTIGVGDN